MKFLLTTCLATTLAWSAIGQPPAKIDVSQFPATMVDDVVVPVPSEIFSVLDKLGSPNWQAQLHQDASDQLGNRPQIALLLGATVAEGFIAVQAQNPEKVKEIGKEVLKLSEAIGVRDAVIQHSNSIIEAADQRDWKRVRTELDRAQQNVRQAMEELRDEQLAQLVSLGGWLRGTEVLTALVQSNYSEDAADLLHQPKLVQYFEKQLDEMPAGFARDAIVKQIQTVLKQIVPLISAETISLESVKEIHDMTEGVMRLIMKS